MSALTAVASELSPDTAESSFSPPSLLLRSDLPSSPNPTSNAHLSAVSDDDDGLHIQSIASHSQRLRASNDTLRDWRKFMENSISTSSAIFTDAETRVAIGADTPIDAEKGFLALCISWSRSAFRFSADDSNDIPVSFASGTEFRNCNPTMINFNNIVVSM